jgi:hypothetical protein
MLLLSLPVVFYEKNIKVGKNTSNDEIFIAVVTATKR